MPRQSRIDAPGALHHIIARGTGRRKMFDNDRDGDDFLERLGTPITEARTACFAWALIPNHFTCMKGDERILGDGDFVNEPGVSMAASAKKLGISCTAVSQSMIRGEQIAGKITIG